MQNAKIIEDIQKLKKERNAVILVHNYQRPEVQDIADYLGDSLGLSIAASKTSAEVIVFCGVDFMAETAAIISPQKTVLMPDANAGCPMADMINVVKLKDLKSRYPGRPVVCYVNSSAEIKAESDICCTSANSVKVVKSLSAQEIIFIPDKYLGLYTQSQLPDKKLIIYDGYCPTHAKIMPEDIKKAKAEHPAAQVMVHPECRPEVIALADAVVSTGGMVEFAKNSPAKEFIVATEIGILYRLQKENPEKAFFAANQKAVCPNMKMTRLEKVLWSLEDMQTKITVLKIIADKARVAIEKMIAVGRQD